VVNEVAPHAKLAPRAKQIAQDICAVDYGIMLQIKNLIEKQNEVSFNEACKLEREGFKDFVGKAKLF
jgi:enoyl-CoA hydratase/carnithine racemase